MEFPKISILPIVSLIVLSLSSFPSYAQNSPQDFLDAHNGLRSQVGVGNLTWSTTVAAYAQTFANQRIGDCSLALSNGSYGENVVTGNLWFTGVDAVSFWASFKDNYDYNSNTCSTPPQTSCDLFTQLVWRTTTQLGCARVECNNKNWFIICNYDPAGNIPGQRPY